MAQTKNKKLSPQYIEDRKIAGEIEDIIRLSVFAKRSAYIAKIRGFMSIAKKWQKSTQPPYVVFRKNVSHIILRFPLTYSLRLI